MKTLGGLELSATNETRMSVAVRCLLLGIGLTCCALAAVGCRGLSRQNQPVEACPIPILTNRQLPTGWTLVPSEEMPMSDACEFWRDNPQYFTGAAVHSWDMEGSPTTASSIWAVAYYSDNDTSAGAVALLCFRYATQAAASADYERMKAIPDESQSQMMGFMRGRRDTILVESLEGPFPDRDFFIKYFSGLVDAVE